MPYLESPHLRVLKKEVAMSQTELKKRLEIVEKKVEELEATLRNGGRKKDWRRTIGMFTDDPGMQELFDDAMKLREADRERARRRYDKPRKAKA
jgi:hypothetical protein